MDSIKSNQIGNSGSNRYPQLSRINTDLPSNLNYTDDTQIDTIIVIPRKANNHNNDNNNNKTDDLLILESENHKQINVICDKEPDYWKIWVVVIIVTALFATLMVLFAHLYMYTISVI